MDNIVLMGRGSKIMPIPRELFEQHITSTPQPYAERFPFMTPDHQRVRYFVVEELPRAAKPLSPAVISQRLNIPADQLAAILNDLEKNLFFLVRNDAGHVAWAYPVTADTTPHKLVFSTGEVIHAA